MIEAEFLKYSADKLEQLTERIQDCLGKLTQDQIWMRHSDSENAVGNLVLHLAGNVRQWIGFGVAGMPNIRDRDSEFAARGGEQAGQRLSAVVTEAVTVLRNLDPNDLAAETTVQGYTITKMEAIYHVVEHFSQHTGQIIFATKLLTGQDLGYYKHLKQPAHTAATP